MKTAASRNATYRFRSEVWIYPGMQGAWHFISVPRRESNEIKKRFGAHARGWGSIPVHSLVGKTLWSTSIFPEKKSGEYILPLKADVRKKEGIWAKDKIVVTLTIKV